MKVKYKKSLNTPLKLILLTHRILTSRLGRLCVLKVVLRKLGWLKI